MWIGSACRSAAAARSSSGIGLRSPRPTIWRPYFPCQSQRRIVLSILLFLRSLYAGAPGKHVNTVNGELTGDILLGGSPEAVEPIRDPHLRQTDIFQEPGDLCLRQSAGDSSRP